MRALLLYEYYYQLENSNATVLAVIFKQNFRQKGNTILD